MRIILFTLLVAALAPNWLFAQKNSKQVVEISGIVVTNDSLRQLLPNCYVVIPKRKQATLTNAEGFFSIVAVAGDTILFSHIGFRHQKLWVPDTLEDKGYLTFIVMDWDRTMLDPVVVYPWPRPEYFKEEFLAMKLPTTEMDIAQRNLALAELKARAAAMGADAAEMQDYMIKLQNQQMYNSNRYYGENGGAAILGALTNPFAWAQFFDAMKKGDFKKK